MIFQKLASFMSRLISGVSISPRLIIILLLYMVVSLCFVFALLSAPLIVLSASFLAALAVDRRAWIKSRVKMLTGGLHGIDKGSKRAA